MVDRGGRGVCMRIWCCFHCFTTDEEEEKENNGGVSSRLKQSAMDNNKGGDFVDFDLNERELGVADERFAAV